MAAGVDVIVAALRHSNELVVAGSAVSAETGQAGRSTEHRLAAAVPTSDGVSFGIPGAVVFPVTDGVKAFNRLSTGAEADRASARCSGHGRVPRWGKGRAS